ncbi:hypothetical protein QJS10_CPB11g00440 [Acorus calamus]|uniref:Uncharacterized protein n=1 Tax=Acorus calamus TaxID=4465 RepID=A0AAV9DRN5_ACOCL|nr:hypothetical protein QJS10_CPB11g00440 [Acorus calamus]
MGRRLSQHGHKSTRSKVLPLIMWAIWLRRNDKIFGHSSVSAEGMWDGAKRNIQAWGCYCVGARCIRVERISIHIIQQMFATVLLGLSFRSPIRVVGKVGAFIALASQSSVHEGYDVLQISPHKRRLRNGPKALKPVPVIIRCNLDVVLIIGELPQKSHSMRKLVLGIRTELRISEAATLLLLQWGEMEQQQREEWFDNDVDDGEVMVRRWNLYISSFFWTCRFGFSTSKANTLADHLAGHRSPSKRELRTTRIKSHIEVRHCSEKGAPNHSASVCHDGRGIVGLYKMPLTRWYSDAARSWAIQSMLRTTTSTLIEWSMIVLHHTLA